jgi:UDP-4-amino-4,6-dideoxy-N-acetyl-beta-L-altrosamine N-acetyltransferase
MRYADCALTPLREEDLPTVLAWRNAPRVRAAMLSPEPIAPADHAAWFRRGLDDPTLARFVFAVSGVPTGFASCSAIDRRHRRCMLGYYVGIADAPPGTGSALMYLALEWIFERAALHKVGCEIMVGNAASLGLVRRFGFSAEGCLREHAFRDGTYVDVELHALLADAWQSVKSRLGARVFDDAPTKDLSA